MSSLFNDFNRVLLDSLIKQEKWQEALPIAIHLSKESAIDAVTLASIYGAMGLSAAVDLAIKSALGKWPDELMILIWWTTYKLETGQVKEAYEVLCSFSVDTSQLGFYYHSLKSRLYQEINDWEAALSAAKIATQLACNANQKESAEMQVVLCLSKLMELDEALSRAFTVLSVNPLSKAALIFIVNQLKLYRRWDEVLNIAGQFGSSKDKDINQYLLSEKILACVETRDYEEACRSLDLYLSNGSVDTVFVEKTHQRLAIKFKEIEQAKIKFASM
jgi:tetratricopeptide (TPR) repeat protein